MGGITGGYSKKNVTRNLYYALIETQHRGQQTAGISTAGNNSLRTCKNEGFISSVFTKDILRLLLHPSDYISIGNVGKNELKRKEDIPPIEIEFQDYKFSISMDGMILNHSEVDKKFGFNTRTDEELFGKIFYKNFKETNETEEAAHLTMEELDKAYYSLVMISHNKDKSELIALRDKRGIKPMHVGMTDDSLFVSSESGALDTLQMLEKNEIKRRDVNPGELIVANNSGFYSKQILPSKPAFCVFEPVYTSRPDTVYNNKSCHTCRMELGRSLANLHKIVYEGKTIITWIPDTGISVALGIHEVTDIPIDLGLIKNQYIGRTYDIPNPDERYTAVFLKHNPIRDRVAGKKVIFGDDSIVRGSISEGVAKTLRNAGAIDAQLAISYGPIFRSCFSDEPNKKLAAAGLEKYDIYEVGRRVTEKLPTISKVMYNDANSVIKAVGFPREHLCTMCMTCENPFQK